VQQAYKYTFTFRFGSEDILRYRGIS